MVEINNQRGRSSICWRGRRRLICGRGTEIMVMTSLWAESYLLITPITLANCHAKPKTQINGSADATKLLSRWWDAYRKRLGLKDFLSEKSGRCWHCSRLRSVALYLWLIVVISSGNRPLRQYLGFTAGRWLWSVRTRLTAWLQIQRSGRNGQRDWCMAESPRLSPSGYLHHRLPVMGC